MLTKATQEKVYRTLKKVFEKNGWGYEPDDSRMMLMTDFMGDDLSIAMMVRVSDIDISLTTIFDYRVPDASRRDFVWELNRLNHALSYGRFSLDPNDGSVYFSYNHIFEDSKPSEELIGSLIAMVIRTTDEQDGELRRMLP